AKSIRDRGSILRRAGDLRHPADGGAYRVRLHPPRGTSRSRRPGGARVQGEA
ncbi:MAG: hypothetical protein AMXMBFR13_12130, partial [Phycisphaerae bacterium]